MIAGLMLPAWSMTRSWSAAAPRAARGIPQAGWRPVRSPKTGSGPDTLSRDMAPAPRAHRDQLLAAPAGRKCPRQSRVLQTPRQLWLEKCKYPSSNSLDHKEVVLDI